MELSKIRGSDHPAVDNPVEVSKPIPDLDLPERFGSSSLNWKDYVKEYDGETITASVVSKQNLVKTAIVGDSLKIEEYGKVGVDTLILSFSDSKTTTYDTLIVGVKDVPLSIGSSNISYPKDNATLIPLNSMFKWRKTTGATSYKVEIFDGSQLIRSLSSADTAIWISSLKASTSYKAVLTSLNADLSSLDTVFFSTVPPKPSPIPLDPIQAVLTIKDQNAHLDLSSRKGVADSVKIQIFASKDHSIFLVDTTTKDGIVDFSFKGFESYPSFELVVNATNVSGQSTSNTVIFTPQTVAIKDIQTHQLSDGPVTLEWFTIQGVLLKTQKTWILHGEIQNLSREFANQHVILSIKRPDGTQMNFPLYSY